MMSGIPSRSASVDAGAAASLDVVPGPEADDRRKVVRGGGDQGVRGIFVLPPEVAAVLGTTFELGMPIFLVLGLGARLAALPLIGMACVIQFVLGANNPDYDNVEHFYWLFLLLMIVFRSLVIPATAADARR